MKMVRHYDKFAQFDQGLKIIGHVLYLFYCRIFVI